MLVVQNFGVNMASKRDQIKMKSEESEVLLLYGKE